MEATVGPDHPRTASCRKWLAGTLQRLGRLDEATAHAREAARIQRDDPYAGLALMTLADVLRARGELDEALRCARESVALTRERLGGEFRAVPRQEALVARILAEKGQTSAARELLSRALPRLITIWGAGHPRIAVYEAISAQLSEEA